MLTSMALHFQCAIGANLSFVDADRFASAKLAMADPSPKEMAQVIKHGYSMPEGTACCIMTLTETVFPTY